MKGIINFLIESGIDPSKIEIMNQFKNSKQSPSKLIKIGNFEKLDDKILKSSPYDIVETSFFGGENLDCFLYYIN